MNSRSGHPSAHPQVLVVLGTRPEAIKLAPVLGALQRRGVSTSVCVTGQHREMLDPVLSFFDIRPDHQLSVMRHGQTLAQLTATILVSVSEILQKTKPALMLVHGDTTTTLAASLAAYYHSVPLGHVEAGLRTGLKNSPFPEEMNRKIAGALTDLHFAPTERAKQNLIAEGHPAERIWITGNTAIDALLHTHNIVSAQSSRYARELHRCGGPNGNGRRKVLITAHRRESFGVGFEQICNAILQLSQHNPSVDFIYPVHMNPNVRGPVESILAPAAGKDLNNLFLIEPLDYPTFVYLMGISEFILTDSGGIQEEAPSLGKRVLVMRAATERPEGVSAGTSVLVGADQQRIVAGVNALLEGSSPAFLGSNPYGDGRAAERIADRVQAHLSSREAAR